MSALAMQSGKLPTSSGLEAGSAKLACPLLRSTVTLPSETFAVARSRSPSPSRSAATTLVGPAPTCSGLVAGSTKLVDAAKRRSGARQQHQHRPDHDASRHPRPS